MYRNQKLKLIPKLPWMQKGGSMRKFDDGGRSIFDQYSSDDIEEGYRQDSTEQYTPYTVVEGDSIWRIARKNNPGATEQEIKAYAEQIMALNGISSDNATIQPGQKLRLPSSSSYVDKPANNEEQKQKEPIWSPNNESPRFIEPNNEHPRIIEPNPNDRNNRGGASGPNKSRILVSPDNTRRKYKPDINNRYPSQYNQFVDDSIDDFE